MHVSRLLGDRNRIFEDDSRLLEVAALAVDLPDQREGIRHHVRVDLPVAQARGFEVGKRIIEAPHTQFGLAAIAQAECKEARERCELGQAHRDIEFLQRLGVGTLLHEMRPTIGADANHLQHVGRLLSRTQRQQVMRVIATPVAVERGEHRHHGMRGRKRAPVTARCRRRKRSARKLATRFHVAADPVRCRHPREQQRHLHRFRFVVDDTALVHRERGLVLAAQVMDQPDAPRERGGQ